MSVPDIRVEKTSSGFCAWAPDLPGCIATGETEAEAREHMAAAMTMHLEALGEAGDTTSPGPS